MNTTIGILGNNLKLSTSFVEKIILKTKANIDQEHIKMNIIINNKLLNKNELYLKELINNIEKSNANYLVLNFNDENIYNYIKNNTKIPVLNNTFNIDDDSLINKIIKLSGKEIKQ